MDAVQPDVTEFHDTLDVQLHQSTGPSFVGAERRAVPPFLACHPRRVARAPGERIIDAVMLQQHCLRRGHRLRGEPVGLRPRGQMRAEVLT